MKLKFSTITIILVVIAAITIDCYFKNWQKQDRVIEHDINHYYGYLPAIFIYNDVKLNKSQYNFEEDKYLFWSVGTDDGKRVIKMSMGLSMLYAPFFFVAHGFALNSNYAADGFSEPYKVFLLLSSIFYLIVGLDFTRRILNYFKFSDLTIGITLGLLGLGTNLLCYASQSAPMPHVYNFALFAIFIYLTLKWHDSPNYKTTILLGLLLGLITLIRPSNIIIAIFFALYNISKLSDIVAKFNYYKHYIIIGICILLIWMPQFIYWKITTGEYIYYSYGDEHFFFKHPKIWSGLFSFRKGWFIYTPLMAFAVAAIVLLKGELKKIQLPLIIFLVINTYIIFSWWCWWYGGTFGQRSFIDCYALLALPLASLVNFIQQKNKLIKYSAVLLAGFFILLNVVQTYQFEIGSLHWEGMSKELYFKQFGKLGRIDNFDQYVDWPNYEEALKGNR